jgi:lysophospholipase L1-like esterase
MLRPGSLVRRAWRRRLALLLALALGLAGAEPAAGPRLLALGDSYVAGEGVPRDASWPVQLKRRLVESGTPIGDSAALARTGWTTADLRAALAGAPLRLPFDLVLLQIGVNDQFQGRDPEAFRRDFVALLDTALELSGGRPKRVLVLSIPDWSVTPFGAHGDQERTRREIERFNEIERQETGRLGLAFVDVTTSSRQAARDRGLVAGDGLHPSERLHALWSDLLLGRARAALAAK